MALQLEERLEKEFLIDVQIMPYRVVFDALPIKTKLNTFCVFVGARRFATIYMLCNAFTIIADQYLSTKVRIGREGGRGRVIVTSL